MEPEDSLRFSKESATDPYPEPHDLGPYHSNPFLQDAS
jgi:hypothetical protein